MPVEKKVSEIIFKPDELCNFNLEVREHKVVLNYNIEAIDELFLVLWKTDWKIGKPNLYELGQQFIELGVYIQDNINAIYNV